MKKVYSVLLLAILLILGACSNETGNTSPNGDTNGDGGSNGDVKTMRMAVATPEERSLTQGLYRFAEIVERETNGSIEVEVYPNGQLGGDREVFEGLQFGSIQGTTISTGPVAQFAPRFTVFDFPFLFPTAEIAYEILDGPIGEELLNDLPDQGVIGLNYWENGFRHLTNNVREVATIDDIRGLDIRTLENDLHIDFWRELGANPTPMAFTELFTGLQQGVVDGQENPVGNVTTTNFYEVQDYITKTNHIYNASLFMISEAFWNTLTDEEKEIITIAADEARDYQRELNQQEDIEAFAFLEEEGMTITELTDEEFEKFFEAVTPVYEKYSSRIGEEFVNQLLEAIQQ
ncbi:ABC transporter substrate-binding protein [Anaerobacillus arseniciselenatis]|uniref:ABC transporter substrate-binding protein n=1 Tax=Anaerobacillus arseniciselenatis TaxID=85682 RepID=A0A1S2LRN5_9BACI|nr:TRAP transporter substrate-binding protein [Anaerobacillus arseniciselenatis]OIJ14045.1 ABC transporter substrate-binding protein [Anaerobacillus arseniciselenatis]